MDEYLILSGTIDGTAYENRLKRFYFKILAGDQDENWKALLEE